MPITQSALKALRKSKRKAKSNKPVKNLVKKTVKQARKNPSVTSLKKVYSSLDKAAKRKIIHKKKASRLKSRLSRLLLKKSSK